MSTDLQYRILAWAVRSFGRVALNRDERAARLVEEAIEVGQTEGLPLDTALRIVYSVYAKPPGELTQEVGGCMLALLALAENSCTDAMADCKTEFDRVLSYPKSHWDERHAAKVTLGTANLSPYGTKEHP